VLAARVDAPALLGNLLRDESPGYAVKVYWSDVLLFQRGETGTDFPPSWTRESFVKTSTGALWRVVHEPSAQFPESIASPSVDYLLLFGLVIAVLMGTLTFENWRAHSRAKAAEVAERTLAEMNRNLETEIASRTRELADTASDLQTITDSVAHDLRNPLNVIGVNVRLFEAKFADALTTESSTVLHRMMAAVRQMADILERMLGLSEVAHSTFHPEMLDMKELISETFDSLAASEPPPVVHLELGELPDAYADRTLVKMLVMNLIGNALKYTRQKDPRWIRVGFEQTAWGGTYRIEDNGIGFPSDSTERLFRAFQRMSDLNLTEGIGLGLAIAARVVNRHRGRIWARGKPGEGATFYFTLEAAPER
jgi:light-regulated signal transduction histidine kinase (bacteriophytochrome)